MMETSCLSELGLFSLEKDVFKSPKRYLKYVLIFSYFAMAFSTTFYIWF